MCRGAQPGSVPGPGILFLLYTSPSVYMVMMCRVQSPKSVGLCRRHRQMDECEPSAVEFSEDQCFVHAVPEALGEKLRLLGEVAA